MNDHYRYFLNKEFETRRQNNARYTLRAYAQFLNLDSGTLSQILKGKRKLPKTHWVSSSKKLKLNQENKNFFLQSLWDEQGIDAKKSLIPERSVQFLSSENYFEIITEWEFAAALCLFDIKHCQFNVQNISRHLGLSTKRANEIYAKLFQFGLIKMDGGQVIRVDRNFESTEDVMSKALQNAHVNELKLSIEKIHSIDVLEREFTSLTFAGNSRQMKKMKLWIRSKRQEFERLFESKKADQVFQFSVQLVPLTSMVEK